jgi:hypothetical protein
VNARSDKPPLTSLFLSEYTTAESFNQMMHVRYGYPGASNSNFPQEIFTTAELAVLKSFAEQTVEPNLKFCIGMWIKNLEMHTTSSQGDGSRSSSLSSDTQGTH